jgi:hypothetical protein
MWPNITERVANKTLLCPFCRYPLSFREDELYCDRGRCGFSSHVTDLIEAGLATARRVAPNGEALPAHTYACPSCGSPLSFREGYGTCEGCGFAAPRGLQFNLLERHHHDESR